MKLFFSPTTKGFYDPEIHGAPTLAEGGPRNPASLIPEDAVEISRAEHQALLQAQAEGQIIQADQAGRPVAVAPAPPAPNVAIQAQIQVLEKSITQRRLREAILAKDNGWLAGVDAQIEALRGQLTP